MPKTLRQRHTCALVTPSQSASAEFDSVRIARRIHCYRAHAIKIGKFHREPLRGLNRLSFILSRRLSPMSFPKAAWTHAEWIRYFRRHMRISVRTDIRPLLKTKGAFG